MAGPSQTTGFLSGSRPILRVLVLAFLVLFAMADTLPPAYGQQTLAPDNSAAGPAQASGTLRVTVIAPDGKPLGAQAVVKLSNKTQHGANWQTTSASETTFHGLAAGSYAVDASAVGYLSGHTEVELTGAAADAKVVLERDPSAVSLGVRASAMPRKARETMQRGIAALEAGNLKSAEKLLGDAEKLAPKNADLDFLLGYAAMQDGALDRAQAYLTQATTLAPQFTRALILLGRVQLLRAQYADATATLERAIAAEPNNWVAHHLLAHAYLQQHENEKAREQAETAVAKGGRDGSFAQFVLGVALAQLGKNSEAMAAFRIFLELQPRSSAAIDAQHWLVLLQMREPNAVVDPWVELNTPDAPAVLPVIADLPPVSTKSFASAWQPPDLDESAPPVAADTSCPAQQVLERAGQRAQQFVEDAGKFAAIETVSDERLDRMGNVGGRDVRKFDYTAAFSQMQANVVHIDEYRTQRYDLDNDRDTFVDTGFAALTLVFHPAMRDDFQMRCEGLGSWNGQPAWLVHFQQRDDRPNRMQAFLVQSVRYPVMLKGRAWISADTFQVVRIESELMHPVPQIQLYAEHEIAEYAPVSFPSHQVELWLPKTAEVYLAFRAGRYHRKHSFDHYMLFSVDTDQQVRQAKDNAGDAASKPENQQAAPN